MQNDKEFLGKERIGKLLFRLAVPTIVAQIINMLYNVVDRMFIGHIEGYGDLALTGVGVCLPIIIMVSAFASFSASGGAPRASIFLGRRDEDSAVRTLGGCFWLQIIISAVLTAVLLLWSEPLLLAFGASENTIAYALDYMSIYALGTVFVQLTLGLNAFISAQGATKISMLSVAIGAVSNIILDPIFIFGFDMGVRGAALATIVSQAISCVWVILFLTGKRTLLRLDIRNASLSPRLILPCIALGAATFVMQGSESVISVCFNASLLKYGGDLAVGAMTILASAMQFMMLPAQGLAQGAQPILSYNFGARKPDRVRATYKLLLFVSLGYTLVMWSIIMLFPEVFASAFTDKAELISFSARALRIYIAGIGVFGIQMACQMTFVSIGNAVASITVAVMRKFVLLLPLIYLLPTFFDSNADKTTAVYLAEPIADVIAVTFTAILFFFQFKKAMKNIEKEI